MIVDLVSTVLLGILTAALGLLPDGTAFSFNLGPAFGAMMTLNTWLPISEAIGAAGLATGVIGAVFAFGLLRQVWRFVPLVGGG